MTVSQEVVRFEVVADGVMTQFVYPQHLLDSSHLQVSVNNSRVTTGFIVVPDASGVGGYVEFDDPPADGDNVLFVRYTPRVQETELKNSGTLPAKKIETALDSLTLQVQELTEGNLDWRGNWDDATEYSPGDVVLNDGKAYVADNHNTDSEPPSDDWSELPTGARGLTWRGTWNSGTAYVIDDAVAYNGSSYIAIADSTASAPPSANWSTLASKGDTGPGGAGSGTVTSVALTVAAIFSVSGSPVTTSGTLDISLATQSANLVWAGPTTGSAATPTFRSLVNADIPTTLTGKTLGATTTISAAPVASAMGTVDIGTTTAAFRDIYLSPSGGSNYQKVTSVALASNRTVTLPDADSVTVIGTTATSNQFLTHITTGGVQTKAQPSSSNLSDASNVALRDNTNSWSAAQIPDAFGTRDLGSTAKPWKDVYLANGGSNYTILRSGSLTGNRTATFPDADSTTVIGTTATSNQFLTHITTGGVQTKAQPSSSNLSDASNVALRDNTNSWTAAQIPNTFATLDLGSTTKPWRDFYFGPNAGSNYQKLTSASLASNRTITAPDADSTTVIGTTATSNQFLTHITTGGVQTKAQPSSSNLSDASNIALRDNNNSYTAAQLPNTFATLDLGSTTKPWRDVYFGPNAGSNYQKLTSVSLTGNRTITAPDSDSTTVIGTTATSNQFLTHVTTGGVQTKAQPSFSNISGTATAAQGGTGVDGSAAANGKVLIGNGSGYTLATLTQGTGITITNGAGSITIAASGGGGGGAPVFTMYAKSADFTASDGTGAYYRVSATANITLPNSPEDGTLLLFKQTSGTGTFVLDASDVIYTAFGTTEASGTTIQTFSGAVMLVAVPGGWEVV